MPGAAIRFERVFTRLSKFATAFEKSKGVFEKGIPRFGPVVQRSTSGEVGISVSYFASWPHDLQE
jgi:hypothetical protein